MESKLYIDNTKKQLLLSGETSLLHGETNTELRWKHIVNTSSSEVNVYGAILKHVWIPCVLTGFANPGCNLHAPDENIHVDKYILGIKYAAAIMEHFGRS